MDALIPARKNSKRIPNKNLKPLAGKPLVLHALQNAYDSECFENVWISTDSAEIAEVAVSWTGCKHIQRPAHLATDESPDIDWVRHALGTIDYKQGSIPDEVALIRPTSPFLGPETIQRAVALWNDIKGQGKPCSNCRSEDLTKMVPQDDRMVCGECFEQIAKGRTQYHSLRAIRRAQEPAWKQWRYDHETHEIDPITSVAARKHLHSRPTNTLEDCWIQTAGMEVFWTRVPLELGTIAGNRVAGFPLEGAEAIDLNTPEDWAEAETYLALESLHGRA